jgi:hypothetical protein
VAELDFEIKGRPGDVSASTFKDALFYAVGLLQEFDSAISGRPRGSLRWYISRLHSNTGLLVAFRPKLKPVRRSKDRIDDPSPTVTTSFLNGFEDLEYRCETPAYLSEYGLHKAEDLTGLIRKNGATGFRFASANRSVDVSERTSDNLAKLLPIKRQAIGSVEGKLEGINLHRNSRFIVYHAITNKAVTCQFDSEKFLNKVKEYLGSRVIVFGTLHKNVNGDTLRITMERLVPSEEARHIQIEEQEITEPEFARATSTAEYIRRIRGGQ